MIRNLNKTKSTKRLSIFPWILVDIINDPKFIWTGVTLKIITIEKKLVETRHKEFDSGWTYQEYWTEWKPEWRFSKIIR